MGENFEKLGQIIDSMDNLSHALNLPIDDSIHVEVLRESLPEKVKELKEIFVDIIGENPWI